MSAKRKVTPSAIKDARIRSLERAVKEERLALAAIVKVMLIEVPDPARVLARLDAMSRAAEANPRTPAAVRKQLIDATLFVKTAIERETGRPQTLFEPDVGHVKPKDVDSLVEPTEGPQQLGLQQDEGLFGDVQDAHRERVATMTSVHAAIVVLLQREGPLTDRELWTHYVADGGTPQQSQKAITERRRELVGSGRVVGAGKGLRGEPAWRLVEQEAAA